MARELYLRSLSAAAALLALPALWGSWPASHHRRLWNKYPAAAANAIKDPATAGNAIIYGVGEDNNIYQQNLGNLNVNSSWTLAGKGIVTFITVHGDKIYAVGGDMRVYNQDLKDMEIATSHWEPVSKASVVSIALQGDTIFAVAEDLRLCKQSLSTMTVSSEWEVTSTRGILSIAVYNDTLYSVAEDRRVYTQKLHEMSATSLWQVASRGKVDTINIQEGIIFAVSDNKLVYKQILAEMTPTSLWQPASNGPIVSVAVWVPGAQTEDRDRIQRVVANEVKNVHYITRGYNIFKGNPDSTSGSDEGFMEPIFELSYKGGTVSIDGLLKVPDGFRLQQHISCNGSFHSDYIDSMGSYLKNVIHRTGLEMLGGLKFLYGAFRLNPDFDVVERFFEHDAKVVVSLARCQTYTASRISHKPVLTAAFQDAIKALPKAYGTGQEYFAFMDRFGTHYPTFMDLGSLYGDVRIVSKKNQAILQERNLSVQSIAAGAAAVNLELAPAPAAHQLQLDNNVFLRHTRPGRLIAEGERPPVSRRGSILKAWVQATKENPIPISYSLALITKLLPASAQVNMHRAFTEYCKTRALPETPEECQSTSECESSADCPEGLYCSLGQCMAICRSKEDCSFPALCIAGHCTETCSNIWVTRYKELDGKSTGERHRSQARYTDLELPYTMDPSKMQGGAPTWRDPSGTHLIYYDESAGDWVLKVLKEQLAILNHSSSHVVRARFRNMPDQHSRRLLASWKVDMSNDEWPDFRPMRVEVGCGECSMLTLNLLDMPWAHDAFREHVESSKRVNGAPVYITENQQMFIYYCGHDSSWYVQTYSDESLLKAKNGECRGVLQSSYGLLSHVWTEPSSSDTMDMVVGSAGMKHTAMPTCASSMGSI